VSLGLWLLACTGDEGPAGLGADARDYLAPDAQYELIALDDTGSDSVWLLRVEEGTWTLREGERWRDAEELAAFEADTSDGLRLDEARVLPPRLEAGAAFEGGSVEAVEATQVWYGLFETAVTVQLDEGRLAGRQVFAAGVGPIVLTVDGEERELALYEWL
jgi:hypothetical protein